MLICLIVIPYTVYAIRINAYGQEHKPEGYQFPHYSQLWITALSALFFLTFSRAVAKLRPYVLQFVPMEKKETGTVLSESKRNATAAKMEKNLVYIVSYTALSIWCWIECKDEPWMPTFLGGRGAFEVSAKDMPFVNCNSNILTLGLVSFGLRVKFMVNQILLERGSKDFFEMLLHDLVTLFLVFGYLFSNLLPVGTMITLLHDVTDVPLQVAKMLNASTYSSLVPIPFVTCQVMWFYFRLCCLPVLIYKVS